MNKTKQTTATKPEYTGDIPNTPMRFFWYVTKPYKWWALFAIVMVIMASVLNTGVVLILQEVINAAEEGSLETVAILGLLYPVIIFLGHGLWRCSGLFERMWIIGVEKHTVDVLTGYSFRHSHTYFTDRFAGSLLSKVSNVSRAMERFSGDMLWHHMESLVSVLTAGVIIFMADSMTGYIYVVLILVLIVSNLFLVPRKRAFSLATASSQTRLRGRVVDVYTNITATRQYNQTAYEGVHIQEHTADVRQKASQSWLYSEYMMFVNSVVLLAFIVPMFIVLQNRWFDGEVSTAQFIVVMVLIFNLAHTLIVMGRAFNDTAAAYGEAEEGLLELVQNHEIVDIENAPELIVDGGQINWKNVTFEFGNNTVFDEFMLSIESGQRIGLVGPSGAGKTTFVSLLLRQHEIHGGAIEIDGQNIAQVQQDSLRANIAVVPQEPLLFHRSIHDNIAYGNPSATQEEIEEAAKKAQAHEFIMKLEEGYATMVGERGIKLSGGQKQRVAIARAMLKNAPILVLDEATSALDSESEVAIQKALHKLMEGKTVIAVAHRLSTLREMDRILVLEAGKIVEDGSHDELAQGGGTYQTLWEHQAGGFLTE